MEGLGKLLEGMGSLRRVKEASGGLGELQEVWRITILAQCSMRAAGPAEADGQTLIPSCFILAAASCYVDCQSMWRGTAHNPKEGRHGITITLKGPCLYIKTVRHMAAWANSRKTMWSK